MVHANNNMHSSPILVTVAAATTTTASALHCRACCPWASCWLRRSLHPLPPPLEVAAVLLATVLASWLLLLVLCRSCSNARIRTNYRHRPVGHHRHHLAVSVSMHHCPCLHELMQLLAPLPIALGHRLSWAAR
jgi:hypothetical protein